MKHVKRLRKKLYALKQEENIAFVHGIGKRNSYSKTDPDATFMQMKKDAIGNGRLKPAFHLQHEVDPEYIVCLTIEPQPTDTTTLIPFLKETAEYLMFKY